jgi:cytochrome c biogenesis protein CcmG, thiol:disulfide interchange protein DsbE
MHALRRSCPLLGLVIIALLPLGAARAAGVEIGEAAPEFSLPSLHAHAEPIHLAAFRGRVLYVDFWSAWCAPCRRAMPGLNALRDELPRDQFELISVNVDAVTADARSVLEQIPVSHPVAVDAARQASASYGVDVLPAGYLVDRDGIVRKVFTGLDAENIGGLRRSVLALVRSEGEALDSQQ